MALSLQVLAFINSYVLLNSSNRIAVFATNMAGRCETAVRMARPCLDIFCACSVQDGHMHTCLRSLIVLLQLPYIRICTSSAAGPD